MVRLFWKKCERGWHQIRAFGVKAVITRLFHDWQLGRHVERLGNRVQLAGLTISVDNPNIGTRAKSLLISGKYESPERNLVERFLPRDLPVLELGASIGVVSCFVNRRLDNPDQHVVVEAHPGLVATLRENAGLNECKFKVVNAAIGYDTESISFYSGSTFLAGSTRPSSGAMFKVAAVSLATLLAEFGDQPICLVADIEGSEIQVVDREIELLRRRVRWAIIETHPDAVGTDDVERMLQVLATAGFVERGREAEVIAFENIALASNAGIHVNGHPPR